MDDIILQILSSKSQLVHDILDFSNNEDEKYEESLEDILPKPTDFSTLIEDEEIVFALDIDAYDRYVYWIDANERTIKRSYIPVSKSSLGYTQKLSSIRNSSRNDHDLSAIAVDWLAKNIYFADNFNRAIKVSTSDGRYTKTLITEHVDEVYSIVVNPILGYLASLQIYIPK